MTYSTNKHNFCGKNGRLLLFFPSSSSSNDVEPSKGQATGDVENRSNIVVVIATNLRANEEINNNDQSSKINASAAELMVNKT